MKITSLKLLKNGYKGAIIGYQDDFISTDHVINTKDNKSWERNMPVSRDMMKELKKLRYFLLSYCGLWANDYNKLLDEETFLLNYDLVKTDLDKFIYDLWSSVEIIRVDRNDKGIQILAEVDTKINDKIVIFKTPYVVEQDDSHTYADCEAIIDDLFKGSIEFFISADLKLPEPKEFLSGYFKNDPGKLQEIDEKDEKEQMEWAIEIIEKKNGGIVIMSDEMSNIPIGDSQEIKPSNGSVNAGLYQEGEEVKKADVEEKEEEEEEKEDKKVKKGKEKKKKDEPADDDKNNLKVYYPEEDDDSPKENINSLDNINEQVEDNDPEDVTDPDDKEQLDW